MIVEAADESHTVRVPHAANVRDRLTVRTKFAFSVGSTADALLNFCIQAYALLFYNQVVGLPAQYAGLAISVGLILDGLSDPIVGSLSDRTRSRLGRRHPFLYFAPVPAVLAFFAVFNPPAGLSHLALFAWFAISVSLFRCCLTTYTVPHLALGGELSADYAERSRVMSFHTFFAWGGTAIGGWIGLTYFFHATPQYPRGLLNPAAYGPFSLVMAVAALAMLWASAWFTRDRIPLMSRTPDHVPPFSPVEFVRDVAKTLRNVNYIWLLLALLFVAVMQGVRGTLGLYTNTYFWHLTSEQIRWFVFASFAGYLAGFMLTARLHSGMGKMRSLVLSAIAYAAGPAIPVILGLAGILRSDTPGLLAILMTFSLIGFAGGSVLYGSTLSVLADIADENELRFGARQEGMLFSTRTLFQKVDQAVGAALGGAVLAFIHFPAHARVGAATATAASRIALWDGVIAAAPGLIAVLFYMRCRMSRSAYETTRAALAARKPIP
jgi:Na+/melibiose symporter-like transporter